MSVFNLETGDTAARYRHARGFGAAEGPTAGVQYVWYRSGREQWCRGDRGRALNRPIQAIF